MNRQLTIINVYPEKENGHLHSIEAIVIVSIVTMNWSIFSEQHKGQRPWPLTTWPETHMKHASTSLGLTNCSNFGNHQGYWADNTWDEDQQFDLGGKNSS